MCAVGDSNVKTKRAIWCSRMMMRSPYFCLCLDEATFHSELKRLDLSRNEWPNFLHTPQAHAAAHFIEHKSGKRAVIVCMGSREGRTSIEIAGLLIHEAVHIFDDEMDFIGERQPSKEFRAYSIQHLAQELLQAYVDASGE